MAAVTICTGFGSPQNEVFHCFPVYLPWSDGTGCHDLIFLNVEFQASLFTLLLLSSRGSLVLCCHKWCHLTIWGYWYFSRQSWFHLVLHPAQHFTWFRRPGFDPWVRYLQGIPWRRQPTPVFLPGEFHGQRSLAGYSPWGCKELDMVKLLELACVHSKGILRCSVT